MGTDIYTKSSSGLNPGLAYFPAIHESSSYTTNNRLSTLQHQLHVSTGPINHQTASHPAWSNLIIPYQPTKLESIHIKEEAKEEITITDDENKEVKKKNPYSIEELLKKPTKKAKTFSDVYMGVHQPFGVFVSNEDFIEDKYQSSSNSSRSGSECDADSEIKIDVE